ncbi:MAG: hypothetical protein GC185_01345 [Alphaproteobacteria bacterium]|nr:hypothetical protein [Alphaproteobacteria bacterium]
MSVLFVTGLTFASYGAAYADPVAGCNPQVLDAMQKKAQAQVALDVSSTEQIINKPDSVLATTCFSNAAGVSAKKGGDIFSGDFTAGLTPIITDSLNMFYKQFSNSEGSKLKDFTGAILPSVVDYTATALNDSPDCDGVSKLWDRVKDEGIKGGVPWATFDDLLNGTMPTGGGDTFKANWDQIKSDNVFADLKAAYTSLPAASIPAFSPGQTACQVLVAAGVPVGPCP